MIYYRLSAGVWAAFFFLVLLMKIIFLLIGGDAQIFGFGGGNDADYYAESAERLGEDGVNSWSFILATLYKFDIFSRKGVSYFLFFVSAAVIPYVVSRLAIISTAAKKSSQIWFSIFLTSIYPVLFFYSLDIYRDVFMTFVFLLGCFAIRGISNKESTGSLFFWVLVGAIFTYVLYGLRAYLGVAYGVTLIYALVNDFFLVEKVKKIRLFSLFVLYISLVFLGFVFNMFNALLEYRSGFDLGAGGSALGLSFDSSLFFLPNFLLSWIFQVFGVWPFSGWAVILFFIESFPFILALIYILRNKKSINNFGWSLLFFFLVYNTIWVLGNDNLGTAWRLRIYGYLSVFLVFLIVGQEKIKNRLVNIKC